VRQHSLAVRAVHEEQTAVLRRRLVDGNPHRKHSIPVRRTEIEVVLVDRFRPSGFGRFQENLAEENSQVCP
jgi:hypothetical protein